MGKLRARTGLDFDLPTEAQWEYACRAGTTTTYSYGNSADGNYMWYDSNSNSKTHVVGTKQPNLWGLYDMHGNVSEWCLDWYGTLSYGTDPKGSSSGSNRVKRGGSWYYYAGSCASFIRGDFLPSLGNYHDGFGFRLFRTLSN
jgi:formylglycine-generating enzyme required for sulfatase activity